MKTENVIDVYSINGSKEATKTFPVKLIVKNVWNGKNLVSLTIKDNEVTVLKEELLKAIENSTDCID